MPASTGLRCVAPPALLIEIDNQTLEPTNNKGGGESQLVQAKQNAKRRHLLPTKHHSCPSQFIKDRSRCR